jgi:hypothetical protein
MFIDLRKALCDNDSSVCKAAAQTFDSLHPMVGSRVLDDILPAMLEQLGDPDMHENALDGLRQILGRPPVPNPPADRKSGQHQGPIHPGPEAEESLYKHLAKILPALHSSLA